MILLTDERAADFRARLVTFEGRTNYLYLDSANPGNVTVGVGCLLATPEDSEALKWDGGMGSVAGLAAREWQTIKSAPTGRMAVWYSHLTKSRLPGAEIDRLLEAKINAVELGVIRHIPDISTFPQTVKQGILDIGYNCGPEKLAGQWFGPNSQFGPAVRRRDWQSAAQASRRKQIPAPGGISKDRNDYVEALIMAA